MLACPRCGAEFELGADSAVCGTCGARYRQLAHCWDLTPTDRWVDGSWEAWDQLQTNGTIAYQMDPQHNLGVGERDDCLRFSRFCAFAGLVLDVGCGPQAWPTYFNVHAAGTVFVGVDPLVGERPAQYTQVRALGEHLPFRDGLFDQVVLATSLDHFVDPIKTLREARRVVRPERPIDVWIGEKAKGAPPAGGRSASWYDELRVPDGAEDPFHVKRLGPVEAEALYTAAGLEVLRHERHPVDVHRTNHFYRLGPRCSPA